MRTFALDAQQALGFLIEQTTYIEQEVIDRLSRQLHLPTNFNPHRLVRKRVGEVGHLLLARQGWSGRLARRDCD